MSSLWTDIPRRGLLIAVAVVLSVLACAAVISTALVGKGGVPKGSALDAEGGGGILQPLPPDTPVSVGIVVTKNLSSKPVHLVEARLLRLDPDVELLGFSALPFAPDAQGVGPPITALEHPLPGAVPLAEFPPLAPKAKEAQVVVMFALGVKPGGAGKAVGVEVRYRQNGKLRRQLFEEQVYVCSVPSLKDADCPGVEDESAVFGEFEDEVKGISGRRDR